MNTVLLMRTLYTLPRALSRCTVFFMVYPKKLHEAMIVQTALELLQDKGIEAVSMRKLAEKLAVSPSSLYRYFSERELLLQTLEAQISHAMLEHILEAIQTESTSDAKANCIKAAHSYLNYARSHPECYALILRSKNDKIYEATLQHGKALWNQVLALVGALTGDDDDTAAAVAFWSFLHGFIILERSGSFGASGAQGGFERGLDALLDGLRV